MLASFGFVFLVILHFNPLILGVYSEATESSLAENVTNSKMCTKSVRKWTDQQILKECTNESRMIAEMKNTTDCCQGYKMINNECKTNCPQRCEHGECDDVERCSCAVGFGGEWCETSCPPGHFGRLCEHNCDCLISQECNPNYQHCKCNEGNIEAECRNICKCRFNLCNPGMIGKNCSVPCPDGSYGQFCSRTCSCVDENTRECLKEYGDCVCKEGFYGMHCERQCTGTLKCDKPNICTCTLTAEQKIELMSQIKDYLIFGLACAIMFLFSLSILVLRYRIKSRRLKNALKDYSLRYSSDRSKVEFSNPIYSNNLLESATLPQSMPAESQPTKKSFLDALKSNSLFNRMNSVSKDWLKSKTGKQANSEAPNGALDQLDDEENDQTYSTIGELKNEKAKRNDPAV